MSLERTASMRSFRPASDVGSYSRASYGDADKLMFMRRPTSDGASDTSSQQERKFANLLGVEDGDQREESQGQTIQNVGHRLFKHGCDRTRAREEALRSEREKILMKEMTQLTQRPAITSRAREKPSKGHQFSDLAAIWQHERDLKVQSIARESRARSEAEVTATPQLNNHSLAIVESSGQYEDPVHGWEKHYAKYCAKRTAPLPKTLFSPNINPNAVRADPDQPIHERLYDDSRVRYDKLYESAKRAREAELHDPATGRPYFSPQALRTPEAQQRATPERNKSVYEALHESSKKKADAAKSDAGDPEATFTPKINPKSVELAEKVRKPLYTPVKIEKSPSKDDAAKEDESKSPNRQKVNLEEFFRRTTRCDHVRQARMEALRNEKQEREEGDLTFQPRINKRSVELFEAAHVYGKPITTPTSAPPPPQSRMTSAGYDSPTLGQPSTTRQAAGSTPRSARAELSQRRSPAPSGGYHLQAASPSRAEAAAAPHASAVGAPGGGAGEDDYLGNFEKQMYAVLDEWRRLEEV